MIIKEIKAGELKSFINSEEYMSMKAVPISRHRALSHLANPRVEENDVVLFLAYEENQLAGYLGVLADSYELKGILHKMGWLSCVWIDPETKGKGVVKALLQQAFNIWDNKIIVTQFTPEARGTYIRSGQFMKPLSRIGFRGYLRFNLHEILPPKKKIFSDLKNFLKLTDFFLNFFNLVRIAFINLQYRPNKSKIEYVSEVGEDVNLFIQKRSVDNFTKRTTTDLNWIIKNPWVLTAPSEDMMSQRYYFSSLDKNYTLLNIKVYNSDNSVKAFLMLTIRRGNLKVPYCYFSPEDAKEIVDIIYDHAIKMQLNMVTVFDPLVSQYMRNHKNPFVYQKDINQEYFISKEFENLKQVTSASFQDGDGDCCFT